MSKKVEVTAKNFSRILSGQVETFRKFRDRVQDLLDFALVQASNGNYTYINELVNASLEGADRRALQVAIEDFADVQLVKVDKEYKFQSKKTKGFEFVPMDKGWWEYKPTAAPKAIDEQMAVIGVIRRLHSALTGEAATAYIENGHKKATRAIIDHLAKTPGLDKKKVSAALGKAAA